MIRLLPLWLITTLAPGLDAASYLAPAAGTNQAVSATVAAQVDQPSGPAVESARTLWNSGRRREALEQQERALRGTPDDEDKRLALAEWQVEVHLYKAALSTLDASTLPPGTSPVRDSLRARCLWMLGRYEEALERLDRSLPLEASLRVRAHLRLGQLEEAREELDALPAEGSTLRLRAELLVLEGEYAPARELLEPLHQQDPHDPELLFLLGRARLRCGAREEGLALLETHRRLTPLFDDLEFARRGVDLDPLHAPGHARVGDVERAIGRSQRAAEAYSRAWALASPEELPPIALRRARLEHEDRDDARAAITLLGEAYGRTRDVRLLVRAGDYARESGDRQLARELYLEARKARPQDPAIRQRIEELGDG